MIGPWPNLIEIPHDNRGTVPPRVPFPEMNRDRACRMFRKTGLRTAFDTRAGELVFFGFPFHNGDPQIYAWCPAGHEPAGVSFIDDAYLMVRSGRQSRATKERRERYGEKRQRSETMDRIRRQQDDQFNDNVRAAIRQDEYRGMGRHFQRSHLIDRNPLAAAT